MLDRIDIRIKPSCDSVALPRYEHPGDGAIDLRSTIDISLEPFERATIPCGFSIAIPDGFAGLVLPRSGLASEHGISIVNSPGLIDSGYRGEIGVVLINLDPKDDFDIHIGDRIAQMMVIAIPKIELIEADELDPTDRGSDGFGSSGVE